MKSNRYKYNGPIFHTCIVVLLIKISSEVNVDIHNCQTSLAHICLTVKRCSMTIIGLRIIFMAHDQIFAFQKITTLHFYD